MARRKAKFNDEVEDVDLIPIMNLVLCLISAVLFNTQLTKIGTINVSAPKIGPSTSKQKDDTDKKPLELTVALGNDGYHLKAKGANLIEVLGVTATEGSSDVKIPKIQEKYLDSKGEELTKESYDFPTLYTHLLKLRNLFPDDKLLTLTAEPDLPFKHLIRTMDIVRYEFKPEGDNTTGTLKGLSNLAKDTLYVTEGQGESKTFKPLWDQVTFAIAVAQ